MANPCVAHTRAAAPRVRRGRSTSKAFSITASFERKRPRPKLANSSSPGRDFTPRPRSAALIGKRCAALLVAAPHVEARWPERHGTVLPEHGRLLALAAEVVGLEMGERGAGRDAGEKGEVGRAEPGARLGPFPPCRSGGAAPRARRRRVEAPAGQLRVSTRRCGPSPPPSEWHRAAQAAPRSV